MKASIETWEINEKMNEFLLKGIKENQLSDRSALKGRSVAEQFAHIHNVRLMWLKAASPVLLENQKKLEKEDAVTKLDLMEYLQQSSQTVSKLLEESFATGRVKGFKPHPEAFLGYLIAHEAHHRGQIILVLKENGHMPDKKVLYGLWEWGNK
jgi:uncharacterized damage-inducible protein DinB